MLPLSKLTPKPLLLVKGQTLLERQINFLRNYVESIAVTVSYMGGSVGSHAIEYGADLVINTKGQGNASWLNQSFFQNMDTQIVVLTCDNLMEFDLLALEIEAAKHPEKSYLVTRQSEKETSGDRVMESCGLITAIGKECKSASLAIGLQVLNPKGLDRNIPKDDFHQVWEELILHQLLHVSRLKPTEWTAIDTPLDLEKANEGW